MANIASRLVAIERRVEAACTRAGRARETVRLVAVSKTFGAEYMVEAYEAGVRHFGENRVQEFASKRPALDLPEAVFHLVGHLQTNKAAKACELFDRVDAVDDIRLAEKLGRFATQQGKELPILMQVRLGGEATKSGAEVESALEFARDISAVAGVRLEGLMAIPPYFEDPESVRPHFRRLRELASVMQSNGVFACESPVLSMGMSHDYEVAIEEGATEIRLGTALFGERE